MVRPKLPDRPQTMYPFTQLPCGGQTVHTQARPRA